MPQRRSQHGELWARLVVQKALGCAVEVNDDGSAPGMYDLRVGPENRPQIAIECVGAVDPTFAELWNIGPAQGPWTLALRGDWIVCLSLEARIRDLKNSLETVLQELEARQIASAHVHGLESSDDSLSTRMQRLCITDAYCYRSGGSGKVGLSLPGVGGAVDEQGTAVPDWLSKFLRGRDRADVLAKLERSRTPQRHAFVIATFHGTPWPIASYLSRGLVHVPPRSPDLPDPLTAAWVVADVGRDGLYWDGARWRIVSTTVESW